MAKATDDTITGKTSMGDDDLLGQLDTDLSNEGAAGEEEAIDDGTQTGGEETGELSEGVHDNAATEGDEEPPPLYLALVEKYGEERGVQEFLRLEGVKADEKAEAENAVADAHEPDVTEAEEWAFDQLHLDAESKAVTAKAEIDTLVQQWNGFNDEQAKIDRAMDTLAAQRKELDRLADESDDRDEIRKYNRQRDELAERIADLKADRKAIDADKNAVSRKYNAVVQQSETANARLAALQKVERFSAKYPLLKANKAIYARLETEGKIPAGAGLNDIYSMISAERVKAGLKPIGAGTAKKTATTAATMPNKKASAAIESWKRTRARLRPVNGVGTQSGNNPTGKGKAGPDTAAKYERTNPALANVMRYADKVYSETVNRNKGGKK